MADEAVSGRHFSGLYTSLWEKTAVGSRLSRTSLVLVAVSSLAIAAIAPASAQSSPAPDGLGSSDGATSLLTLALGTDSLVLRVLGEDSLTSNDPAAGGPTATERVSPLQVTSTLLPALAAVSQPTVETTSTSGEQTRATPAVDLGALLTGAAVPGLLTGTLDPVALRSAVDATGAVSRASGSVRDLALLGGLLRTGTASADLGSGALVTDAGASRSLALDRLEVLDLAALLDALGISLADLPLDTAVGLLAGLGLPLPGDLSVDALLATVDGLLDQTSAVRAQVTTLQGQIDALQGQLAPLTSQLSAATAQVTSLTSQLAAQQALLSACVVPALCAPLQALVTSLTGQLATATASVASIDAAIDGLQAQIDGLVDQIEALLATVRGALDQLLGLVDGVVDGLEGAPLLVVEDLTVGLRALADDTLATSEATVVGAIGDVRVGALSLGGLDPATALGQAVGLGDTVTGAVGDVLGLIDPSLAGIVDVALLEQATSVTEAGGVTEAVAGITALRATITPPDVCGLLSRLGAQETLGSLLGSLGEVLPSLPGPVGDVLGTLGSTVTCNLATAAGDVSAMALVDGVASALTQPLTLSALSVTGAASFSAPAVPATPGTPGTPGAPGQLPVTGGNGQLAVLALAVGVLGLGLRRILVRTS